MKILADAKYAASVGQLAVDQGTEYNYSRGTGWETVRRWEGIETDIKGLMAQCATDAESIRVTRSGDSPIWQIESRIGGVDVPDSGEESLTVTDRWELVCNNIEQSIMLNPIAIAAVGGSSGMQLVAQIYQFWIKEKYSETSESDNRDGAMNAVEEKFAAAYWDAAKTLVGKLIMGEDKYLTFAHVYRRTRVCTRLSDIQLNFSGSNMLWTTAQILSFEQPPADMGFALGDIPVTVWLKIPPTVTKTAGQRAEMVYEYWGATSADTLLYAVYTG